MNILFLDQSGKLGGAELSLLDVAAHYRDRALVGLLQDGPFREQLETREIPVQVLTRETLAMRKEGNLLQALQSVSQLLPLVNHVAQLSRAYDVIYANTPKAFIVGALASYRSGCPLVYHLRDIISVEHFSHLNRTLLITLANARCRLVIANSHATRQAFIQAGGHPDRVQVVYNGFHPDAYPVNAPAAHSLRQHLDIGDRCVVGHFSRLSPWKGQHMLIDALSHCPDTVVALLVGDALFGEDDYVAQLHQQVQQLGLQHRVKFLGFRSDIPALMGACDLVAHTSTAPEPFGRVIIEAMLCQTPVVAAAAGGAVELINHGQTGWLTPPGDTQKLADIIKMADEQPEKSRAIAVAARHHARTHFDLNTTNAQISALLNQHVSPRT
jgi:glycosyltransferase involved in cell wall biosynthesis